MANKAKKTSSKVARSSSKAATFREEADKKRVKAGKRRVIKRSASTAKKPFVVVGRFIKKILRPFSFLLLPFKTRPARFVGRILGKVFFVNYFVASWKELRQVKWPNRRETAKMTVAVVIFAVVFGLFIAVIDYGLEKLFREVLL